MSDPPMQLPPGFRFHPTDEELILHYLRNRATESPCPVAIIADVDIYKFDPWALPSKANYGDREWYFFTPRDRKYPNGVRPNRAAGSGYWKSTGTDKPVRSSATGESVGVKKALVFYKGRPPKGIKTNWIMHEYRLATAGANTYRPIKFRSASMTMTMRLDEWVLCRICYRKMSQVSVPPLSDHELDEPCGAYPMSMSSAGMIMEGGAGAAGAPRMPSISELPRECSLAQLFNGNGLSGHAEMARHEYDQHAALLGHPIMNQLDVNSSGNNMSQLSQMDSSSVGTGKRKRLSEEDGSHNGWTSQPADKKPNGSCFGATTFPNRQQRLTGVTRPGSSDAAPFLIWPHGDWMNWW